MAEVSAATNLGLLGVGLLGLELARAALGRGFRVWGCDPDPSRGELLVAAGGRHAEDSAALARNCPTIVLCLPHSGVARQVVTALGPALSAGQRIVDTTTGDPCDSVALAYELAARGVAYLDATVLGSSVQLAKREALLLVGGERAAFEACQSLWEAWSERVFHLGPAGTGAQMKLVANLVLGLNRAALAEGLALAAALGLSEQTALDVLQAGPAASQIMHTKGPKMLARDFAPQARLAQHLKDVELILAAGRAKDLPLPLAAAHRALLQECVARGWGPLDNSALRLAYDAPAERTAPDA